MEEGEKKLEELLQEWYEGNDIEDFELNNCLSIKTILGSLSGRLRVECETYEENELSNKEFAERVQNVAAALDVVVKKIPF